MKDRILNAISVMLLPVQCPRIQVVDEKSVEMLRSSCLPGTSPNDGCPSTRLYLLGPVAVSMPLQRLNAVSSPADGGARFHGNVRSRHERPSWFLCLPDA